MAKRIRNVVMIALFIAFVLVIGAMNLFTAEIMAAGYMGIMRVVLAIVTVALMVSTNIKCKSKT